ncbi:hypothetical protein GCM10010218_41740 [Streptomyces mashuensis]|uniref:Peptidoglycan binding-like domain-containing protein n=1 Tax=Streptomyces mashuensis TaxID=33904 RepID=A0A919EDF9_9ACTN|nr:peptidoglycan-binding domain-containing protein [Streptomyces mashuensis]GHF55833.1 hypothetical protein GCM10010218_41740 [Streptomyces mashuensis]
MAVRRLPLFLAAALAGGALAFGPSLAPGGATAHANGTNGEWRLCPYKGSHPQIAKGNANDAVGHAQCILNHVYGYHNVTVDKKFGDTTLATVKDFQMSVGLKSDGIIGPNTWAALHP